MQLVILDSAQAIAQRAADEIEALLKDKPAAVLGTATGSSPLPLYDELTARCAAGRLSFAEVTGFMLDEYVGLPEDHPERYATFMERNLRSRVDMRPGALHGPDALNPDLQAACEDYEAAMALIDERAGSWRLRADKVAVLGFSSGGHLAACAATMARRRPAAAILVYPLLAGPTLELCMPGPDVPVPVEHVDARTSPVFHVQSRDDTLTPVGDALALLTALGRSGVTFESHVYAYGEHGFSTAAPGLNAAGAVPERTRHWVADAISWLDDVLGPLTAQGVGEPRVSGRTDADLEDVLSLDCTVGHLLAQEGQAREALAPPLDALDAMEMEVIRRSGLVAPGVDEDTARRTFRRLIAPARLRGVLGLVGASAEEMDSLDQWLRRIPNRR